MELNKELLIQMAKTLYKDWLKSYCNESCSLEEHIQDCLKGDH